MKGKIHSIQSLGTVDGPGVRAVVFTSGCPLRCIYCHNPDTWEMRGEEWDAKKLAEKLLRLYPYIKNGGVTFSGGEPCLQAKFLTELASFLKERGLHIALDTSGAVYSKDVDLLLDTVDLVLLDIKFTDDEAYKLNTGATLTQVVEFLDRLEEKGKDVWIRHVVVPDLNDSDDDIKRLAQLIKPYKCVKKTELLPFKKLCLEKYESLGIPFPLRDTPEMSAGRLAELYCVLKQNLDEM